MTRANKVVKLGDVLTPWDKVHTLGPEAMRDEELLAVILRNRRRNLSPLKQASALLRQYSLQRLLVMDREEMGRYLTKPKAGLLLAGFELAKRALNDGIGITPTITKPADAIPLLSDIKDKQREHFAAIFLNGRNQVVHSEVISIGSLNASLVHPREVFAPAVGSSAASVLLAHNHPTGDITPSREDVELTRRLVHAGEILGIEVLDHLILGSERFMSLKEAGLM